MTNDESLLELPFDQFQRYQAIAQTAAILRQERKSLKVLDVGGFPGVISRFLPEDDTHIVDVEPSDIANYYQGSGSDLPFDDSHFDMVTAVDTYEHVAQDERPRFLAELFRVSRGPVVMIGPFASEHIELAEQFIYDFSEKTLGKDFADSHPLKEHIALGLPSLSETLAAFTNQGLRFQSFPSGYLYNWLILNFVKHFLFTIPESDSLHRSIDYYYNKFFYEDDKKDPAYRTMIVGVPPEQAGLLAKIADSYNSQPKADEGDIAFRLGFFGFLVNVFDLGTKRELKELKYSNLELSERCRQAEFKGDDLERRLAESRRLAERFQRMAEEYETEIAELKRQIENQAAVINGPHQNSHQSGQGILSRLVGRRK